MDDGAYFVGVSKKDLDNHWAQIVGKFSNFRSGKDKVDVSNIGVDHVAILLNGVEVYNSVLPGSFTRCKHKVSSERGNKGKVVIKLEKVRPGNWVDKWSPSRNEASPSFGSLAGTDSLSSDSHISLPKFFDNLNSSKNGADSSH